MLQKQVAMPRQPQCGAIGIAANAATCPAPLHSRAARRLVAAPLHSRQQRRRPAVVAFLFPNNGNSGSGNSASATATAVPFWAAGSPSPLIAASPDAATALAAGASSTGPGGAPTKYSEDGSEGSGAQHRPRGREGRRWRETDEARAFRRTSFSFADWRKHRSQRRYFYHLSTLAASRIVWGLLPPVATIAAFAAAICAFNSAAVAGLLPAPFAPLSVPVEPFQLTSFALALLLVFRTNAAYARWLEARCVFGRIADAARDVYRQALAVFPSGSDGDGSNSGSGSSHVVSGSGGHIVGSSGAHAIGSSSSAHAGSSSSGGGSGSSGVDSSADAAKDAMLRWLVAYCYASKWALREEGRVADDLKGWLPPHELRELLAARDPAHYALLVASHALRAALASEPLLLAKLQKDLGAMMYDLSSCTRILTTPIPLSYTRHTTRFMALWLLLLPAALWASCGWGTPWAAALISLALLTIEAIGVSLEEPFSILALETICERCRASMLALRDMDAGARAAAAAVDGAGSVGGGAAADGGGFDALFVSGGGGGYSSPPRPSSPALSKR